MRNPLRNATNAKSAVVIARATVRKSLRGVQATSTHGTSLEWPLKTPPEPNLLQEVPGPRHIESFDSPIETVLQHTRGTGHIFGVDTSTSLDTSMNSAQSSMDNLVALALVAFSLFLMIAQRSSSAWKSRTGGHPLPPGPPQLPVIGNVHNIPKVKPWYGFRDLCDIYGDVIHFNILGQRQVVLGSAAAISEFLETRTANTSDRMATPVTKLTGNDWILGLIPYGPRWRSYRRAIWQYFHPGAIEKYRPVQIAVAHTFLQKLMKKPEHFKQHIRFAFAATILKIGYGIDVDDEENELIQVVAEALEGAGQAFVPGRFLVDYLPYIPTWMPGAGFQTLFAKWRRASNRVREMPFERRNTAYTSHVMPGPISIADSLMVRLSRENSGDAQAIEELVKDVVAVAFEAGADTTFSTLQATFLAMALYPEVQKKAQAELDAVVGPERLPDFEDRDALVYVNAIVKESLRWFNVTPLSIPHHTVEDDVIQGYFIPAGTVLVPNIWACMHDPTEYKNPDEFNPERFIRDGKLDRNVRDPFSLAFGSGRRICPGRYFADTSMFLNVACVLHVFKISLPVDATGKEVEIKPQMTDGFLSHLEDCRCMIEPRSKVAQDLIDASSVVSGRGL